MQASGVPPPPLPYAVAADLQETIANLMKLGVDFDTAGLYAIFLPDVAAAHMRALRQDLRLAHYTSAENAMKIADGKVLWLRSVKDMNDFTEVEHGAKSVQLALNCDAGRALVSALKHIDNQVADAVTSAADELLPSLYQNVFIACLSEHRPTCPTESKYGRLSMWRAYAKEHGVANMKPMRTVTDHFDAYSLPVLYAEQQEVVRKIGSIAEAINTNRQFLAQLVLRV